MLTADDEGCTQTCISDVCLSENEGARYRWISAAMSLAYLSRYEHVSTTAARHLLVMTAH